MESTVIHVFLYPEGVQIVECKTMPTTGASSSEALIQANQNIAYRMSAATSNEVANQADD